MMLRIITTTEFNVHDNHLQALHLLRSLYEHLAEDNWKGFVPTHEIQ